MRSKRVPDRVHVVHPPRDIPQDIYERDAQDDFTGGQDDMRGVPSQGNGRDLRGGEIVRMLAQISDRLKRSEAERYELLGELREYRKALSELEDKNGKTARACVALENKIQERGRLDTEITQRQVRLEKTVKDTEDKVVKSVASQALLNKRLQDTEDRQTAIDLRLDESVTEQARLDRQIEKVGQDKSRMLRKVERLEEIIVETQDALKARAMVLLTDRSAAAQSGAPQIPAWLDGEAAADGAGVNPAQAGNWRRAINMQSAGMAALVIAALLSGWMINQVQQPEIPQIAILEGGGLARLNLDDKRWEPVVVDGQNVPSERMDTLAAQAEQEEREALDRNARLNVIRPDTTSVTQDSPESAQAIEATATPETGQEIHAAEQTAEAAAVLDYSDEQLLAALDENPDALAAQLNQIAPAAAEALELETPAPAATQVIETEPVEKNAAINSATVPASASFPKTAFQQDPVLANAISKEKGTQSLSERIKPDPNLPERIQSLEAQAFEGLAEAQHDLAAIYTAGHGGVEQDFARAALWFREAADGGVGNASYNLGVLYHQGLGVERDLARALYWYREAAQRDHPEAQYNLGIAHIEGIGTEYSPPLAAAFFERAANNGIMEAAYNLGLIYENGLLGGEVKPEEALLWYKIAADQGSLDAQAALKQLAGAQQIGMEDVDKLVERMQKVYETVKGRRAGPLPAGREEASAGKKSLAAEAASLSSSATQSRQAVTAQIQEHLMTMGLYPGPADGISGPQTEDAIRAYQSANNLPEDGQADEALLTYMLSGPATE